MKVNGAHGSQIDGSDPECKIVRTAKGLLVQDILKGQWTFQEGGFTQHTHMYIGIYIYIVTGNYHIKLTYILV